MVPLPDGLVLVAEARRLLPYLMRLCLPDGFERDGWWIACRAHVLMGGPCGGIWWTPDRMRGGCEVISLIGYLVGLNHPASLRHLAALLRVPPDLGEGGLGP
jgi:hypothetical protein